MLQWLARSKHFFGCHEIPDKDQVVIATFHQDGQAQVWYRILFEEEGILPWHEFRDRLMGRFGPSPYDHVVSDLIKLQQTGTVAEYQNNLRYY